MAVRAIMSGFRLAQIFVCMPEEAIQVKGARVNNLKNISFSVPINKMTVVTGVSGSGKSSLAFDTIYAEGQRRYVESMSAYARQFLERMEKPDADEILGIAPSVAIKQKNTTRNPRSTVGTTTEIYDYLRLLYARIGQTFCWNCGSEVRKESVDEVAAKLLAIAEKNGASNGLRAYVLFPMIRVSAPVSSEQAEQEGDDRRQNRQAHELDAERLKTRLFDLRKLGFNRLYQSGTIVEFSTPESLLEIDFRNPVYVLTDRLAISAESRQRLIDALEICYREGGDAVVEFPDSEQDPAFPRRMVFNDRFECKMCSIAYVEPEPRLFSFNSPYGACPRCHGFGNTIDFDPDLVIPDPTLTLDEGAVSPWTKPRYRHFYYEFKKVAREKGIRLDVPYCKLAEAEKQFLWDGRAEGKR